MPSRSRHSCAVRSDGVFDITVVAATMADLCNADDPVALAGAKGERIGSLEEIVSGLLAPVDLQAIKAAGIGLVAVGSRDPNRFFPGMGTLFLRMMGESLTAALARYAD